MEFINDIIVKINDPLYFPILVILLLGIGL